MEKINFLVIQGMTSCMEELKRITCLEVRVTTVFTARMDQTPFMAKKVMIGSKGARERTSLLEEKAKTFAKVKYFLIVKKETLQVTLKNTMASW